MEYSGPLRAQLSQDDQDEEDTGGAMAKKDVGDSKDLSVKSGLQRQRTGTDATACPACVRCRKSAGIHDTESHDSNRAL